MAQVPLPRGLSQYERQQLPLKVKHGDPLNESVTAMRPTKPVRTLAEWEEIDALLITWTGYKQELSQIVHHAQRHVQVLILCKDSVATRQELTQVYGVPLLQSVSLLHADFNSMWMRDYGPQSAYLQPKDSLILIDWVYNRPRPQDDTTCFVIAEKMDIPLYRTHRSPDDLVHVGGNFMADGMGGGFSSKLVLEENAAGNAYGVSPKSESTIDDIMHVYGGIDQYAKFETLPFDGIHHIDMHMKLLDERTLLVGKFPQGISDGLQIEQNISTFQSQHLLRDSIPYVIERIVQPPCDNGFYPPHCQSPFEYRTYTNALFINQLILVPIYGETTDAEALETWRKLKPGYEVVGINCEAVIRSGGALHCIAREIGTQMPLQLSHYRIDTACAETELRFEVRAQHRSGVQRVTLHCDAGNGYATWPMTTSHGMWWHVTLPPFAADTRIQYYISGEANDGKLQHRPMPAPQAYYAFTIGNCSVSTSDLLRRDTSLYLYKPFPNPSNDQIACKIKIEQSSTVFVALYDYFGRCVSTLYQGRLASGTHTFSIHATTLPSGMYRLVARSKEHVQSRTLSVVH